MPTEQDIYDKDGDLETQVLYGQYQVFSGMLFPSTITINRTLEEYRIALTVEKMTFNQPLPTISFPPKIPESYKVQRCRRWQTCKADAVAGRIAKAVQRP